MISEEELKQVLLNSDTGFDKPETQYKFHPERRWKFDFAWPEYKIAVEVEGGVYGRKIQCHRCGVIVKIKTKNGGYYEPRIGGRHNSGKGFENDCEKYNSAVLLGWNVLRFPTTSAIDQVMSDIQTMIKAKMK